MQKVVKFLESYVQWVALALGIAWIGWVGYSYWATPPVAIEIGGQKLGPGEVDEFIAKPGNAIDTISKGLQNKLPVPKGVLAKLDLKNAPRYAEEFKTDMSLASLDGSPMRPWTPSVEFDPLKGPEKIDGAMVKLGVPIIVPGTITSLGAQAGQSVAKYPDAKAVPNPNDPNAQLSVLVNPNIPDAKPILLVPRELNWISPSFNLDMKQLADAFKDFSPTAAYTQFLNVELIRQEQLPDGSWGPEKTVPDPANQFRLPWPPAPGDDELLFVDWALKHTLDIIQPPFYEVQAGNLWHTASMAEPIDPNKPTQAAVNESVFDPAKPPKPPWTPEQRKLIEEYRKQKADEEQAARKAKAEQNKQRPTGGSTTPGRTPRGGMIIPRGDDSIASRMLLAEGPLPPNPGGLRSRPIGPGVEGRPIPTAPPVPNGTIPLDPNRPAVPAGAFSPANEKDQEIWAHDETTEPGKIYRYKVKLSLKNPLFGTSGMAKNPADEKKLALVATSDWSKPVKSPSREAFYVINGGTVMPVPKVGVEYLWWEWGDWKNKVLTLQPGDAVGETKWTLVDLRPDNTGSYKIIFVNETGEIVSRSAKADLKDDTYQKLKSLIKAATPPPGASVGQ